MNRVIDHIDESISFESDGNPAEQPDAERVDSYFRRNDRIALILVVVTAIAVIATMAYVWGGNATLPYVAGCLIAAGVTGALAWLQARDNLLAVTISGMAGVAMLAVAIMVIIVFVISSTYGRVDDPPDPAFIAVAVVLLTGWIYVGLLMTRTAILAWMWRDFGIHLRQLREKWKRRRPADRCELERENA
jgi:hypothetical protein